MWLSTVGGQTYALHTQCIWMSGQFLKCPVNQNLASHVVRNHMFLTENLTESTDWKGTCVYANCPPDRSKGTVIMICICVKLIDSKAQCITMPKRQHFKSCTTALAYGSACNVKKKKKKNRQIRCLLNWDFCSPHARE